MNKTATHRGVTITFNEEEHSYTDNLGRKYVSATTLIKNWFPPFNSDKIASMCAGKGKYIDMSVKQVLAAWEEKRDNAGIKGTFLHTYLEGLFQGKDVKEFDKDTLEKYKDYLPTCHKVYEDLNSRGYEIVELEKILFCPNLLISGTVDAIFKHKATGHYLIVDWKTNEEIKQKNYHSKGLDVLKIYDDCNYIHYCLQLNLYEYLLEIGGHYPYFDYKKEIYHIQPNGFVVYEVSEMRKEIEYITKL